MTNVQLILHDYLIDFAIAFVIVAIAKVSVTYL